MFLLDDLRDAQELVAGTLPTARFAHAIGLLDRSFETGRLGSSNRSLMVPNERPKISNSLRFSPGSDQTASYDLLSEAIVIGLAIF